MKIFLIIVTVVLGILAELFDLTKKDKKWKEFPSNLTSYGVAFFLAILISGLFSIILTVKEDRKQELEKIALKSEIAKLLEFQSQESERLNQDIFLNYQLIYSKSNSIVLIPKEIFDTEIFDGLNCLRDKRYPKDYQGISIQCLNDFFTDEIEMILSFELTSYENLENDIQYIMFKCQLDSFRLNYRSGRLASFHNKIKIKPAGPNSSVKDFCFKNGKFDIRNRELEIRIQDSISFKAPFPDFRGIKAYVSLKKWDGKELVFKSEVSNRGTDISFNTNCWEKNTVTNNK